MKYKVKVTNIKLDNNDAQFKTCNFHEIKMSVVPNLHNEGPLY